MKYKLYRVNYKLLKEKLFYNEEAPQEVILTWYSSTPTDRALLFDLVHFGVVTLLGSVPHDATFLGRVETVDIFHVLIGLQNRLSQRNKFHVKFRS